MLSSIAYAMGNMNQSGGQQPSGTDMLMQFLPLILMFVIFWFLLIRPQQKRAKAHKQMLAQLKRGDRIVTSSGIIGQIVELDDEQALIESGTSKIRISRAAIGGLVQTRAGSDADAKK